MSDQEKREPIRSPEEHGKRDGARAVAEAVASFEPITAALTRIYQTTHPSKSEQERRAWQGVVTERTNEHSDRLDQHETLLQPTETLDGVAAVLARQLTRSCPDAMGQTFYDLDDMCALLPEASRPEVEDAAHELAILGLLAMNHHSQGWHARLTPFAYEQLDPPIMGWDPTKDAAAIATLMLEHKTGHAPELERLTGWPRRRFNSSFRIILKLFPPGRTRSVIQPDYPSLGVSIAPEDRVQLKRFIKATLREE